MSSEKAAVALFVYNRLGHLKSVVESLQRNSLAKDSLLFIFSDGPASSADEVAVEAVRSFCGTISGFKEVKLLTSDRNFGLAKSIIRGVSELTDSRDGVIVIEDDIVVSRRFLEFMNWGLEKCRAETRICSISGYSYPFSWRPDHNYFLRITSSWGWATWKSAWKIFDADAISLRRKLKEQRLDDYFDFSGTYGYSKMLRDYILGKNNSWAIRWYASAVLNRRLTLYPARSMVRNIGFDGSGVHCSPTTRFDTTLDDEFCNKSEVAIIEPPEASRAMSEYFLSSKPSLEARIRAKIGKWLAVGRL